VRGDGFIAASYRHRISRAGDPQLHTHVVVGNLTRADGRYTALDAHALYEHKSAAGAVYRAVLRAEVHERLPWVSWRPAGRGLFEIAGVPEPVLRHFSQRREGIEERAALTAGSPAVEAKPDLEPLYRRLSGSSGLTEMHNTFARRRALPEHGVRVADRGYAPGDRIVARRNLPNPRRSRLPGSDASTRTPPATRSTPRSSTRFWHGSTTPSRHAQHSTTSSPNRRAPPAMTGTTPPPCTRSACTSTSAGQ
jgi:TrwC relaxase